MRRADTAPAYMHAATREHTPAESGLVRIWCTCRCGWRAVAWRTRAGENDVRSAHAEHARGMAAARKRADEAAEQAKAHRRAADEAWGRALRSPLNRRRQTDDPGDDEPDSEMRSPRRRQPEREADWEAEAGG